MGILPNPSSHGSPASSTRRATIELHAASLLELLVPCPCSGRRGVPGPAGGHARDQELDADTLADDPREWSSPTTRQPGGPGVEPIFAGSFPGPVVKLYTGRYFVSQRCDTDGLPLLSLRSV